MHGAIDSEAEYEATQKCKICFYPDVRHHVRKSSFLSLILEANLHMASVIDEPTPPAPEKINGQKLAFMSWLYFVQISASRWTFDIAKK